MKNDHRSKFSNLSNWKEEAWKNQGFNGIRTRDLRDAGAMLYQLSYEATHWERGQFRSNFQMAKTLIDENKPFDVLKMYKDRNCKVALLMVSAEFSKDEPLMN